jgi:hypothetical protein
LPKERVGLGESGVDGDRIIRGTGRRRLKSLNGLQTEGVVAGNGKQKAQERYERTKNTKAKEAKD